MDETWRDESACLRVDPEAFFPEAGRGFRRRTRMAQAICFNCPVRLDCLRWAIDTKQRYGVWGGLPQRQLSALITEINMKRTTFDEWIETWGMAS